jgi:hypothetical protein
VAASVVPWYVTAISSSKSAIILVRYECR